MLKDRGPFHTQSSLYILYGRTDDFYCLPDLRLVDITRYLQEKLLHLGYGRIAFHHPLKGIRLVTSGEATEADAQPVSRSKPAGSPGIIAGPLGRTRLRPRPAASRPEANRTASDPDEREITKIPDAELFVNLLAFLKQRSGAAAYVFESFEYFLNGIERNVLPKLTQLLRDVNSARSEKAICIFISQYYDVQNFVADKNDRGHFLHSFRDNFFDSNGNPRGNIVRIGPPCADEILNTQRRMRLTKNLATRFRTVKQNCENLARELRSETDLHGISLKEAMGRIEEISSLASEDKPPAIEQIANLSGRDRVASELNQIIEYAVAEQRAKTVPPIAAETPTCRRLSFAPSLRPIARVDLSLAFIGKPGTGKTAVARLFAKALKESGILPSGHFIEAKASDLVAGYVGQTALKTAALFDSAIGGVIFIDEVQAFTKDNQFHVEAIKTMLKYPEDRKGEIAVIIATYPEEFERFLALDRGLPRRFSKKIDFDDYDGETCRAIFRNLAAQSSVDMDAELDGKLATLFDLWRLDRTPPQEFANAGSVVNLFQSVAESRAGQHRSTPITTENLPPAFQDYARRARKPGSCDDSVDAELEKLAALIGLTEVKDAVNRIVARIRAQRIRGGDRPFAPGHFSFVGRPGTGKTTVARILGDVFRELGVLKSGHLIEARRTDLVAGYQGQTAPLVHETIKRALDGVLFIDEAHNLINDERDSFGREAIGELTPLLENHRTCLCTILAGYPDEMERLFSIDPGWKSRFTHQIHFEDYDHNEMAAVFRLLAANNDLKLDPMLDGALPVIMEKLRCSEGGDFANGRSARNLLDHMSTELDLRLTADPEGIDHYLLTMQDAPLHLIG